MKKHSIILLFFGILIFYACRKPKKFAVAKYTIADSVQIATAKDTFLLEKQPNQLDFKYLSSDAKIDFSDGTNDSKFKIKMRIRKDSLIWLSVQANIGIEGLRIMADKDSIRILNYQEKTHKIYSYKEMSQEYGFEFTYGLFEAILVGDMPIKVFDKNKVLKDAQTGKYLIMQQEKFLRLTNYLNTSTMKLEKLSVKDLNTVSQLELDYSEFVALGENLFAEKSNFILNYNNKQGFYQLKAEINCKKTKITDTALEFPFRVPEKYKKTR